jgi:ribosomal protein L37AE/L43A
VKPSNNQIEIINILNKNGAELKFSKNNKTTLISKKCPFCNVTSKRVFRYNLKLKVGKCYCCGTSFKNIEWLKTLIKQKNNPEYLNNVNYFTTLHQLKNNHGLSEFIKLFCQRVKQIKYQYDIMENIKNNMLIKDDSSDKDLELPF